MYEEQTSRTRSEDGNRTTRLGVMADWPEAPHREDHGTELLPEHLEPGIAAVRKVHQRARWHHLPLGEAAPEPGLRRREHPVAGLEAVSPALQHRSDTFMARPPGRGGLLAPVHASVDQVQVASADRSPVGVQQHLALGGHRGVDLDHLESPWLHELSG